MAATLPAGIELSRAARLAVAAHPPIRERKNIPAPVGKVTLYEGRNRRVDA